MLAYPVVLPELPVWAREWFADHLPRGVEASAVMPPFRPSVICSHYSTLKTIVQKSNAVSALTELSLQRNPHAREFAVIDFTGIRPSSNPGIVTLKKRTLSPAALRLIEELVAVADQR